MSRSPSKMTVGGKGLCRRSLSRDGRVHKGGENPSPRESRVWGPEGARGGRGRSEEVETQE